MPTSLDKILNSQFVLIGLAGLAFLIALWLVVVIVRMMTGRRLRFNGGRTRQARLGIVDAFDLDRQRQLIIVRRDNTEHLIMIGGPNDLVIESEIVRVEARDNRRASDKPDAFADRIPAPTMAPDESTSIADEPLLPSPVPASIAERPRRSFDGSAPDPTIETLPLRTPTFPLPRRPEPERRPPPPPETASRMDEPTPPRPTKPAAAPEPAAPPFPAPFVPVPSVSRSAPAEAAAPPPSDTFPAPPPVPPQILPPIVPTQGTDVPPRPVRPPPPSFLKPLPPRPPIRPLRRANPLAPGIPIAPTGPVPPLRPDAAAPAGAAVPEPRPPSALEPSPVAEAPAPREAPPVDPVAPPPAPTKAEEPQALESLEEEMAKLLGRG